MNMAEESVDSRIAKKIAAARQKPTKQPAPKNPTALRDKERLIEELYPDDPEKQRAAKEMLITKTNKPTPDSADIFTAKGKAYADMMKAAGMISDQGVDTTKTPREATDYMKYLALSAAKYGLPNDTTQTPVPAVEPSKKGLIAEIRDWGRKLGKSKGGALGALLGPLNVPANVIWPVTPTNIKVQLPDGTMVNRDELQSGDVYIFNGKPYKKK